MSRRLRLWGKSQPAIERYLSGGDSYHHLRHLPTSQPGHDPPRRITSHGRIDVATHTVVRLRPGARVLETCSYHEPAVRVRGSGRLRSVHTYTTTRAVNQRGLDKHNTEQLDGETNRQPRCTLTTGRRATNTVELCMWTKCRVGNCVANIWDSFDRLTAGLLTAGAVICAWLTATSGVTLRATSAGGTTVRCGW